MKKIGITGSLASGKTTASKILSSGRGPLFSADLIVKKLYKKKSFINLLKKKLKIDHDQNLKKKLINIIKLFNQGAIKNPYKYYSKQIKFKKKELKFDFIQ